MEEVTVKLKFTDNELIQIEELKNKLDLKNNAEVIAYAVSLLIRIDEKRKQSAREQIFSFFRAS